MEDTAFDESSTCTSKQCSDVTYEPDIKSIHTKKFFGFVKIFDDGNLPRPPADRFLKFLVVFLCAHCVRIQYQEKFLVCLIKLFLILILIVSNLFILQIKLNMNCLSSCAFLILVFKIPSSLANSYTFNTSYGE